MIYNKIISYQSAAAIFIMTSNQSAVFVISLMIILIDLTATLTSAASSDGTVEYDDNDYTS